MKRKHITLIAFTCFLICSAGNNKQVDLSFIKGQSEINYEIDWSEVTICGLNIEDWLDYRQSEQVEYDVINELDNELKPQATRMIISANQELGKNNFKLTRKENSRYTIFIYPQNVDANGNNQLRCKVVDSEKHYNDVIFTIAGKGGKVGSMSNLWGDGFKNAGKKLASMILDSIKK